MSVDELTVYNRKIMKSALLVLTLVLVGISTIAHTKTGGVAEKGGITSYFTNLRSVTVTQKQQRGVSSHRGGSHALGEEGINDDHKYINAPATALEIAADMTNSPTYIKIAKNEDGTIDSMNILLVDMSKDYKEAQYADGKYIAAATEGGPIYYSSDFGETFTSYLESSGVYKWKALSINYVGEEITAMVKDEASDNEAMMKIRRSDDFGINWKDVSLDEGLYAQMAVSMTGQNIYLTVNDADDYPSIKYSLDGGESWDATTVFGILGLENPVEFVALACDWSGKDVYAASAQQEDGKGAIFVSTDSGFSYFALTAVEPAVWSGIYTSNWLGKVYFVEKNTGSIFYSRDKGGTIRHTGALPWTGDDLSHGITMCVGSDYGTYDSVIWASRKGDFLYKSFDKGSTFHRDVQSGTQAWGSICIIRADGRYGIINVENDGFYTDKPPHEDLTDEELLHAYRAVGPVTDNNLLLSDVAMSSNGQYVVAAFGNNEMGGSGLYVVDDGNTDRVGRWSRMSPISLDKFEERGVAISDDGKKLVVVGWGGENLRVAVKSDDSGATWVPIEDSVNSQFVAASADHQYIYIVKTTPEATLLISRDYGANWAKKELNFTDEFYAFTSIVCSTDGAKVYLSSYDTYGKGYIYTSGDFAVSFTEVPVIKSVHYVDEGKPSAELPLIDWGFLATNSDGMKVAAVKYESNVIYLSSNAGVTWSRVSTAPEAFTSICMSGDGMKIMGTGAYLYVSLDGGLSWKRDVVSGVDGWLSCTLSLDGAKGAIKRVLPDDKYFRSAVYLNKPTIGNSTFENVYPYISTSTPNASAVREAHESPAPSMEPTTVAQFFIPNFGYPTQAPTASVDITNDCYTDDTHAPGKRGTGSQSNMRVYSEGECTALKGTYTGYGECLKPSGASFSYDCYILPDAGSASVGSNPGSQHPTATAERSKSVV